MSAQQLEKDVRVLKAYAVVVTVSFVGLLGAFRLQDSSVSSFQEIRARRVLIVDSAGQGRVLMASDYKNDNSAGVYFFNQEGTESGALNYNGKLNKDGAVEAYAVWTMDQFKNDEVVRVGHDQIGDQKRHGLSISDRPDTLTVRAQQLLADLSKALQSAKSTEEARALRREYLARVPARELGARRLFAGRDVEGTSMLMLLDQDGKARLRIQVDKLGNASIAFLDDSGRVVRAITP